MINKTFRLIFLAVLWITIISTVYWANSWETTWNDIDWKFGVFFCNNSDEPTTSLQMITAPWKKNKICLYFINDSDYDLSMIAWITDWTEQPSIDGQINIDCNLVSRPNKIDNYKEQDREVPITIPANTRIKKDTYITFPIWVEWEVHSCLIYWLDETKSAWPMFNFKFRTTLFLDFFVSGDFSGDNNIVLYDFNKYLSYDWALNIDAKIKSDSALNNIVDIKWNISSIFWYNKDFFFTWIELNSKTEESISTSELGLDTYLPRYKWLYNIKLHALYKPHFEFDISALDIDESILEKKEITVSTIYFEMPPVILWILLLIILLLFLAFRKPKQKIVYVKQ